MSDRLCQERELSVVKEKTAEVRYTLSEKALIEKNQYSWKDEVREKVNQIKQTTNSYIEFKQELLDKHGIEFQERGKHTTYINHENGKRVRGNKLGQDYEKETIKHEFERKVERGQERGTRDLSNESSGKGTLPFNEHVFRTNRTNRGEDERFSNGTVQRHEKIHAARDGIREGTEGTTGSHQEAQQYDRAAERNIGKSTNRSQKKSERSTSSPEDKTSSNGPGTRRANHTNESTWPGHDRTRDEIQAGTKANHEGTIDGNRITNSSDCRANISPIRNTNPTPSVNGSELLNDLLKSVEQSAKQIEAQQKAEQAQSQRLRLPKRQQLQKDQEWER